MTINEFRWGVKPTIPGHWCGRLRHDGFDVEIAADWIEARKEDDGQPDSQQACAQQIVEGIVRKIGLAEKTRFTATLGSASRFNPQSNRRDINVFVSEGLGLKASVHADVVVTSAGGAVVADSRADRMAELPKFTNDASNNVTLRRMADFLLGYYADPEKKLAPLFDIIELAREAFGHWQKAAPSLGISIQRIKKATGIMNNSSVRSGRHPGRELGQPRDPTPDEVQLCEAVAEQIVSGYTKLVRCGAAPK